MSEAILLIGKTLVYALCGCAVCGFIVVLLIHLEGRYEAKKMKREEEQRPPTPLQRLEQLRLWSRHIIQQQDAAVLEIVELTGCCEEDAWELLDGNCSPCQLIKRSSARKRA